LRKTKEGEGNRELYSLLHPNRRRRRHGNGSSVRHLETGLHCYKGEFPLALGKVKTLLISLA